MGVSGENFPRGEREKVRVVIDRACTECSRSAALAEQLSLLFSQGRAGRFHFQGWRRGGVGGVCRRPLATPERESVLVEGMRATCTLGRSVRATRHGPGVRCMCRPAASFIDPPPAAAHAGGGRWAPLPPFATSHQPPATSHHLTTPHSDSR